MFRVSGLRLTGLKLSNRDFRFRVQNSGLEGPCIDWLFVQAGSIQRNVCQQRAIVDLGTVDLVVEYVWFSISSLYIRLLVVAICDTFPAGLSTGRHDDTR